MTLHASVPEASFAKLASVDAGIFYCLVDSIHKLLTSSINFASLESVSANCESFASGVPTIHQQQLAIVMLALLNCPRFYRDNLRMASHIFDTFQLSFNSAHQMHPIQLAARRQNGVCLPAFQEGKSCAIHAPRNPRYSR